MINNKLFENDIKEAKEIELKLKIIDDTIELLNLLKRKILSLETIDLEFLINNININDSITDDFNSEIQKILLNKLKCKPHLSGYLYLYEALKIVYEKPDSIHSITKFLYPEVAKKCSKILDNNIKSSNVERGIRHTIQTSINNINKYDYEEIFGNDQNLTNSAYIAYVIEYYRKQKNNKIHKKV